MLGYSLNYHITGKLLFFYRSKGFSDELLEFRLKAIRFIYFELVKSYTY